MKIFGNKSARLTSPVEEIRRWKKQKRRCQGGMGSFDRKLTRKGSVAKKKQVLLKTGMTQWKRLAKSLVSSCWYQAANKAVGGSKTANCCRSAIRKKAWQDFPIGRGHACHRKPRLYKRTCQWRGWEEPRSSLSVEAEMARLQGSGRSPS